MSMPGQINCHLTGKRVKQVLKDPKNGLLLIETVCGHTIKIKHADGDFFYAGMDVNIALPPIRDSMQLGRLLS